MRKILLRVTDSGIAVVQSGTTLGLYRSFREAAAARAELMGSAIESSVLVRRNRERGGVEVNHD